MEEEGPTENDGGSNTTKAPTDRTTRGEIEAKRGGEQSGGGNNVDDNKHERGTGTTSNTSSREGSSPEGESSSG